ncbi:MAG TPA: TRC40/GET3/ArsA family transport-energizing ATPase [Nitrososphaeraceae archaeon]
MRLIIYTGKGGTGKTVISSSTAFKLAEKKYKTIIISSDPAHTLSDAFQLHSTITRDRNDNGTMDVFPFLQALQIDPTLEMNTRYHDVITYIASMFSSKGIDEVLAYEIAMMPGMTQLFSLLKVEEVMRLRSHEVVVLDMPASGEALRYLYFPKLLGKIGNRFASLLGAFSGFTEIFRAFSGISIPNKILRYEKDLFNSLNQLSDIIKDNSITTLRLVANPDSFSIENAKRAFMAASLYGINTDLAVINKIFPDKYNEVKSDEFFINWTKFQQVKVSEARSNFYPLPIREVPLHSTELAGIEMLRANADIIFGDDDPLKIFYNGKPYSIVDQLPKNLRIKIKVPFTEKEDIDIKRLGSEVIIKLNSPTGNLVNVIPLPTITFDMKMIGTRLRNNTLNVLFERGD